MGGEPTRFLSVVGDWSIVNDEGKKVLLVDGWAWKKGAAGRRVGGQGARHLRLAPRGVHRLCEGLRLLPLRRGPGVDDFRGGEISLRFKLLGGALDQCAGILFNLKPNGDYLAVRFNGKEDNLVLWTFDKGKRSFVKKGVKDVHIPFKEWHSMKIAVHGTQLEGYLDGEKLLDYTLAAPVSGKVGVWSKTDSIAEMADYVVQPE